MIGRWQPYSIGNLGRVVTGKTPPSSRPECFGEDFPFITPSDIGSDTRKVETERYLSMVGKQSMPNYLLPEKTVCVVCIGATIGKVCMTHRASTTNQQINSIVVDEQRFDPHFVYYTMRKIGPSLLGLASGAATPIINKSSFSNVEITAPKLPTQRRIASILSAYDDLIENNTRRIAILEEMARRIYEEWFVHFRFPGHEQVKMVESELGLIPEGWSLCQLGDVCARITDGSHSSPPSVDIGKPMASVKDMTDWGINTRSCRKISDEDYEKLVRNDCKPKLNDVLIAKDGSYLKHTFVVDEEIDLVVLSSIAILRPNGKFLPNQLALYLRLPQIKERMKGYVSGVAIPRIILKDFRQFLILVPPSALQNDWAERCDVMLSLCRKLVRKNANLRTTRDLLLPKLISGELDVSNLPTPEEVSAA